MSFRSPEPDDDGADSLEFGTEPRRSRRRALAAAAVVVVAASLTVSVIVPAHRAAEQRRARTSYDRLLTLSAAGEASVERAVSQERDVAQYAEPLLNSSLTGPQTRQTLYALLDTTAREARSDIDTQLQVMTTDPVIRAARLKAARQATLAYFAGWSSVFASAAGASGAADGSNDNVLAQQDAARTALEAAAPDRARAAQAGLILGTVGD
jgi:hypothetical protein